jgi:hypothetical protein
MTLPIELRFRIYDYIRPDLTEKDPDFDMEDGLEMIAYTPGPALGSSSSLYHRAAGLPYIPINQEMRSITLLMLSQAATWSVCAVINAKDSTRCQWRNLPWKWIYCPPPGSIRKVIIDLRSREIDALHYESFRVIRGLHVELYDRKPYCEVSILTPRDDPFGLWYLDGWVIQQLRDSAERFLRWTIVNKCDHSVDFQVSDWKDLVEYLVEYLVVEFDEVLWASKD